MIQYVKTLLDLIYGHFIQRAWATGKLYFVILKWLLMDCFHLFKLSSIYSSVCLFIDSFLVFAFMISLFLFLVFLSSVSTL